MRYTIWLWDRIEDDTPIGRFAKVCWDDVNNGCALSTFSAQEWIHHFKHKHPGSNQVFIHKFADAFTAYKHFTESK